MIGIVDRLKGNPLHWAIVLGLIGALVMGFVVASTVTSTNLGNTNVKLATESFVDDGDTTVSGVGIVVLSTSGSAVTSVEAFTTYGALNNALTAGNYAYRFDVQEFGATTWAVSQTYEIKVYETTSGTTSLLGTFNTLQAAADAGVEGVTVTVDVGSTSIPDSFDIVVTKQ